MGCVSPGRASELDTELLALLAAGDNLSVSGSAEICEIFELTELLRVGFIYTWSWWKLVACSERLASPRLTLVSPSSSSSVCRRVVHRNSSRHTLHTHKTSTRLRYSLLPACPTLSPLAPTSPLYFFSSSIGLGERGDARETTKDRREGGGQRGGPRDAKAEEPPALLSLPNQTRAGAAGTGLLPLWSVPVHHTSTALSHVLIKSGSSSTQRFFFMILLGAKFESQIR